jgi:potassium-transporting ATPase KdpC subunit
MRRQIATAVRLFGLMTLLTGLIYPLAITGIAQVAMPHRANGSLVYRGGEVIGSRLIGQSMNQEGYFWPRPSAIDYNPLHPSGGSNLGPTSTELKREVDGRERSLGAGAPTDLLYASGSGLDPHLSLEAADFQVPRIAKARSVSEEELHQLIHSLQKGRQFGLLGPRYVNVLDLNEKLDERFRK